MVEHKLVSFPTVIALWSLQCNLTNKAAISHTPKVEIHTNYEGKVCHFGRYVAKAKLFCLKSFVLVFLLECLFGNIFRFRLPRSCLYCQPVNFLPSRQLKKSLKYFQHFPDASVWVKCKIWKRIQTETHLIRFQLFTLYNTKYRRRTDPDGRYDQNEIKRSKGINYILEH